MAAMQLIGPKYALWEGAVTGNVEVEAPHLYKINGWYYLLVAEAGTEHNHAVTIARSQHLTGPYQGNPRNPILTHRHLGYNFPIACTGHSDLVETQHGEWWLVLLATRPYDGYFYNLGRETFLAPVIWEDGWPIVAPGVGRVEFEFPAPNLPEQPLPLLPACDHFKADSLDYRWNFLRTPRTPFWSLTDRPDYLRLKLRPERLSEPVNPSFIGRRQQHINFVAHTAVEFTPANVNECAGLVLLQNNNFHFRLTVTQADDGGRVAQLIQRQDGQETLLGQIPVTAARFYLKVSAVGQAYSFYAASAPDEWRPLAEAVDGRILSTNLAGGFVGTYLGLYASSNGQPGANHADFDWFEYQPLPR